MTPPAGESAAASRARAAPGILERVQALLPEVAAYADETERERRIAAPLVAAMLEAGLFRMLLPRPFNGFETDPLTFITAIEEIAKADASTAWSLCQTTVRSVRRSCPLRCRRELHRRREPSSSR